MINQYNTNKSLYKNSTNISSFKAKYKMVQHVRTYWISHGKKKKFTPNKGILET